MSNEMKSKPIKPRFFWAYPAQVKDGSAYIASKRLGVSQDMRVLLIDLSPEGVEALRDKIHRLPYRHRTHADSSAYRDGIEAALAAIGIKARRAGK